MLGYVYFNNNACSSVNKCCLPKFLGVFFVCLFWGYFWGFVPHKLFKIMVFNSLGHKKQYTICSEIASISICCFSSNIFIQKIQAMKLHPFLTRRWNWTQENLWRYGDSDALFVSVQQRIHLMKHRWIFPIVITFTILTFGR